MGLINPSETTKRIKLMEYLKTNTQMLETDNLVSEVGTMQNLNHLTSSSACREYASDHQDLFFSLIQLASFSV